MTPLEYFLWFWIVLAIVIFPIQLFTTAPYGRHTKSGWGPLIPNKFGWVMMEGWAFITFAVVYMLYFNNNLYSLFFAGLYLFHYFNRSFIYPLRTRTDSKKIPLTIVLSGMLFNSANAGLNSYYLSNVMEYATEYFLQWNFILGLILFLGGFAINFISDHMLINLRKPGETGYKIPKGFLFKYISCPNLFGEIIEWLGFALMCNNLAAWSFFVWTFSNLAPRAFDHHKWYKQKFAEYPKERKALIPFVV
jgi:3-oxo-5-alpha-steroid 4-dehydrogenase 1